MPQLGAEAPQNIVHPDYPQVAQTIDAGMRFYGPTQPFLNQTRRP